MRCGPSARDRPVDAGFSQITFLEPQVLGQKCDFAIGGFGEGVNYIALGIEMAKGEELVCRFEMAEAVDLVEEGTALDDLIAFIIEISAAASGEEEGGGMAIELEMLQVMIVACKVKVNLVLSEKRLPICNEDLVIAMRAV